MKIMHNSLKTNAYGGSPKFLKKGSFFSVRVTLGVMRVTLGHPKQVTLHIV